ncbi:hypothetical protein [Streptomyces sp. PSKA30]|uniref:hypothetical protein n=1 Tax=Streptomyces sp. PSKA30 TaxID=2874597 RepID=UPI001CD0C417|nr:hypothetical protein [Streptomyces sp. PSKA30]MBZ9642362.1 hypothetical protein [Streptomyces sp. PSKA30]
MDYWPYPPVEADRVDPFDSGRTETQYVLFGGHRPTSAFTDPALFDHPDLHQWIPWGYKILRRAQKVAIHRHGDLVREWPVLYRDPRVDPVDPPAGETLYLDNWRRSVCGYRILTSPTAMTAAEDAYDYAAATEMARAASRAEGRALVVYMYDAENWH